MKKVIAIAFSDLHIHDWAKFNPENKRTLNHLGVLDLIYKKCRKYGVPALFCGDLFHKPENMSLNLFKLVNKKFKELDNPYELWKMYAISGNHSLGGVAKYLQKYPSWVEEFSKLYNWLECIDFQKIPLGDDYWVYGVPYMDHNIGLNEFIKGITLDKKRKNILLLHTDYPGAKDTDESEVGTCENLNTNLLQAFDLVLIGHIHKPQRLGKKIYMLGAPLQQRRTDRDCKMGYWKIYSDLSMKFREIKGMPKFIDVESPDQIKGDSNYYTVISKPKEVEFQENKVTRDLSKRKLVREYMRAKKIKDIDKKHLLLNLIKEAEND